MNLDALQGWVFETGLMVSLLIFAILLIRRLFAQWFGANAAYALWSLPLIRLCLPGMSVPESWVPSVFRTSPIPRSDVVAAPVTDLSTITENIPSIFTQTNVSANQSVSSIGIVLAIWIGVGVMWLVFQFWQQRQFRMRLEAETTRPNQTLFVEIENAAHRLGLKETPQVRVSKDEIGPLITGVARPLVVLPHSFEDDFNIDQRGFALIHEFTHLKRKDLWVAFIVLMFRAVNWPNPLVHFAAHRLRADQEAACDAFVLKVTGGDSAHSYAETLVKAARRPRHQAGKTGRLALSLTDDDSNISKGDER